MMLKDLNIIIDSARAYGVSLPTSAVNAQLFAALIAAGQGDLDNSAVIGVIEELAGEKLEVGD
jgi:2-hydroxy-3-oxopropionate reductase